MQRRTATCVRPSTNESCSVTNHTKDYDWETLAQRRTITRKHALFKAYSGERPWKAIRDRLRRPYYFSRVDHDRQRKQRTDIGKYSFVNRSIKNWNQIPAEALGTCHYKPKIFRELGEQL